MEWATHLPLATTKAVPWCTPRQHTHHTRQALPLLRPGRHGNHRIFLLMCVYLSAAAVHASALLYRYDLRLLSALTSSWWGASAADVTAPQVAAGASAAGSGGSTGGEVAPAASTGAHAGWLGPFWLHAVAQVCQGPEIAVLSLNILDLRACRLECC